MKTDPQNSDYVVESGAARNYEPWRATDEALESEKRKREAEEMGDAMKSLENRAQDSKQDMDIMASLEEMRSLKSRHATVSIDDVLATLHHIKQKKTNLGIQIFRFYFKCTKCSAELTMKTDPQNSDYVVESGATRNYEPWRATDEALESEKRKREEEEMGDAMKSLENRAHDSKQDMDKMASLEEMRSLKSRHATVSIDDVLATLHHIKQEKEQKMMDEIDKADEEVIKSIVFPGHKEYVRRIQDDEEEDDEDEDDFNEKGRSTSGVPSIVGKPMHIPCIVGKQTH